MINIFRFLLLSFFFQTLYVRGDLGDLVADKGARMELFADVDNDGDGDVSVEEVIRYVNETGGVDNIFLDETSEINEAARSVMIRVDHPSDKEVLSADDLSAYWRSVSYLLSVDEVRDWAAHSQLLPENIVSKFVQLGITGYDFPELVAKEGILIETELGVKIVSVKARIMRGIRMKLMGMGAPPAAPTDGSATPKSCSRSRIAWDDALNDHMHPFDASGSSDTDDDRSSPVFPSTPLVHRYVVQRSVTIEPDSLLTEWRTVYAGPDKSFVDNYEMTSTDIPRQYRVAAWNIFDRSEYFYFQESPPALGVCSNSAVVYNRGNGSGSGSFVSTANASVPDGNNTHTNSDSFSSLMQWIEWFWFLFKIGSVIQTVIILRSLFPKTNIASMVTSYFNSTVMPPSDNGAKSNRAQCASGAVAGAAPIGKQSSNIIGKAINKAKAMLTPTTLRRHRSCEEPITSTRGRSHSPPYSYNLLHGSDPVPSNPRVRKDDLETIRRNLSIDTDTASPLDGAESEATSYFMPPKTIKRTFSAGNIFAKQKALSTSSSSSLSVLQSAASKECALCQRKFKSRWYSWKTARRAHECFKCHASFCTDCGIVCSESKKCTHTDTCCCKGCHNINVTLGKPGSPKGGSKFI